MKHTTIKSNRTGPDGIDKDNAIRTAFKKALSEVGQVSVFIQWVRRGYNVSDVALVAVYTMDASRTRFEAFLGVWRVVVPHNPVAPLQVSFSHRRDVSASLMTNKPYRPALLPLRFGRLCPDFNMDDPFNGAADFFPVKS